VVLGVLLGAARAGADSPGLVMPGIPADSIQVSDNVKSCEGTATFYEHAYKTPPLDSAAEFDLIVIGLLDATGHLHHGPPLVWLYFGPRKEIVRALVTIPGQDIEDLSQGQLTERWPHVCDMLEDLLSRAGRM
jgi:hypothetical protein